jgi:hypothetical protein
MSPHRLCVILHCLLLAHTVLASTGKEQLQKYKAAKKHYDTSNYAAAKAIMPYLLTITESQPWQKIPLRLSSKSILAGSSEMRYGTG